MSWRLLNFQGAIGLAASLLLLMLMLVQKVETRHWKKRAATQEQLYHREQAAHAQTVANHRAAVAQAHASDRFNLERVSAALRSINERTAHDFEERLANARARAGQLHEAGTAAADPGSRGSTALPAAGAAAPAADAAAPQDRLSDASDRAGDALIATEQAIQLDELIKWVRRQASVDVNGEPLEQR